MGKIAALLKIIFFVFVFLGWLLVLAGGLLYYYRVPVAGHFLEPLLEQKLSRLFEMDVAITHLRPDIVTGHVEVDRIRFFNQKEFHPTPHLDNEGLVFDINFGALLRKEVLIKSVTFTRPFYFIEQIATKEGPRNNIGTWLESIKNRPGRKPHSGPNPWKVAIDKITIHEGVFIYHNRVEDEMKWTFKNLNGSLDGFYWPSDPNTLSQKVELYGDFGEKFPAAFSIKGPANFSTSKVGFDLELRIRDGDLKEHVHLWKGLPVTIDAGRFELNARVRCRLRELNSVNQLLLKDLKLSQAETLKGKIWGYPTMAWIGFLEQQETIELQVPLKGNVQDPKFKMQQAFRRAFQSALRAHAAKGANFITEQSKKLAQTTGDFAQRASNKISQGFEKISTTVKEKAEATTTALTQNIKELHE